MLYTEKNIMFTDLPIPQQRGVCCIKRSIESSNESEQCKTEWIIDNNIPIFSIHREYIEDTFLMKGDINDT